MLNKRYCYTGAGLDNLTNYCDFVTESDHILFLHDKSHIKRCSSVIIIGPSPSRQSYSNNEHRGFL